VKKIEIVYGAECRRRDRQEKLELCQRYPGVARKKRDVDGYSEHTNLRMNRDITPPDETQEPGNNSLKALGIANEVQAIVDEVYKVSSKALRNARAKYCNVSKSDLRTIDNAESNGTKPDIIGIIESITNYAKNMVDRAVGNLTEFCAASGSFDMYERARCPYYNGRPCPQTYRSTKSGAVKYSTQHRPVYVQSTKNVGGAWRHKQYGRMGTSNNTENSTDDTKSRSKRDVMDEGTTVSIARTIKDLGVAQKSNHTENKTVENVRQKRSAGTTGKQGDASVTGSVITKNSSKGDLRMSTEIEPEIRMRQKDLRRRLK
jgi:hypothetical protein